MSYAHHWLQGLRYCVVLFSLMSGDGFPWREGSALPLEPFSLSVWWCFWRCYSSFLANSSLPHKQMMNSPFGCEDCYRKRPVSKSIVKSICNQNSTFSDNFEQARWCPVCPLSHTCCPERRGSLLDPAQAAGMGVAGLACLRRVLINSQAYKGIDVSKTSHLF